MLFQYIKITFLYIIILFSTVTYPNPSLSSSNRQNDTTLNNPNQDPLVGQINVTNNSKESSYKRIAVLDHDYVMQESIAAIKVRKILDDCRLEFENNTKELEQNLRKLEQELIALQPKLTEQQFAEKRQAFENKVSETQKNVAEHRGRLEESFNQARETIVEAILKIVAAIAKEHNYDIVLPRSMIFYADEVLNISLDVLKRLNKELPELKLDNKLMIKKEHE